LILSRDYAVHPLAKGSRILRSDKEILHPRRCAVRKSSGTGPFTKDAEERTQEKEQFNPRHEGLSPPLPPTPPTRPSLRHKRYLHPFHPPSPGQRPTALGNKQTAAPTWDWLAKPGHPRGISLPTPPLWLPGVWGLGSGGERDLVILLVPPQNQHRLSARLC